MSTLEICQRIAAIDNERIELEDQLRQTTGKGYDEFMAGMSQLFSGGMSIRIGDGPEMSVDEFLESERSAR